MAELKPCPCPVCGVKLKKKITVRSEIVFDHPRNGCLYEWKRVRSYKEAIEAWNRRVGAKDGQS